MDLNSQELRSVFIMGAGGLVTAVLYQLGSTFLKQSTDDVKLDPATEALQHNGELLHLFHQLAQYRKFNENAYRKSVLSADELALRLKQAQAKEIVLTMEDVSDAFAMYQDSIKQAKKLCASARTMGNPRVAAEIHRLVEKIYPELQQAYATIHRLLHQM